MEELIRKLEYAIRVDDSVTVTNTLTEHPGLIHYKRKGNSGEVLILGASNIKNRARILDLLIEEGADINTRQYGNFTPLHSLCHLGDIEGVKVLLKRKANVNLLTADRRAAIHIVASRRDATIARLLLQAGAIINDTNVYGGLTPLHLACDRGDLNLAYLLMQYGADLTLRDKWNRTPLYLSYYSTCPKLSFYLIKKGATTSEISDDEDQSINQLYRHQQIGILAKYERAIKCYPLIEFSEMIDHRYNDECPAVKVMGSHDLMRCVIDFLK